MTAAVGSSLFYYYHC